MLEREIGAPAATAARIAQLVENLPSDTVEAPRTGSFPCLVASVDGAGGPA